MGTITVIIGVLVVMDIAAIVLLERLATKSRYMDSRINELQTKLDRVNEDYNIVFGKLKELTKLLDTMAKAYDDIDTHLKRVLEIVKSIKESDSA